VNGPDEVLQLLIWAWTRGDYMPLKRQVVVEFGVFSDQMVISVVRICSVCGCDLCIGWKVETGWYRLLAAVTCVGLDPSLTVVRSVVEENLTCCGRMEHPEIREAVPL
jgi:hypothetical protein